MGVRVVICKVCVLSCARQCKTCFPAEGGASEDGAIYSLDTEFCSLSGCDFEETTKLNCVEVSTWSESVTCNVTHGTKILSQTTSEGGRRCRSLHYNVVYVFTAGV